MRKSLIYSLVLHIVLFSLALLLVSEKEVKIPKPFSARIVTPEELKEQGITIPPVPHQRYQEERESRMPRLPKDLPPPRDFSAVPVPRTFGEGHQKPPPRKSSPAKGRSAAQSQKEILTSKSSGSLSQNGPDASQKEERSSSVIGQQGMLKYGNESGDDLKKSQSSSTGAKTQSSGILKEKLFDRNIINQLAQRKEKEDAKPNSAITFDTSDFKYYGYMQRLKEKIEGIWKYPPDAAGKGLFGDLYIKFTIKKNGKLGAVELVRTSGHRKLDDAAIKALKDAEPYWPLPTNWEDDGLTITGHFIYSLYGTYIR